MKLRTLTEWTSRGRLVKKGMKALSFQYGVAMFAKWQTKAIK